jgi:hypothetical protein
MSDQERPSGPKIIVGDPLGSDRRTADRIVYEVEAHITHGDNVVAAKTENVSASGAFLGVPALLPVGSRIRLKFKLPAGDFEAAATIVRIRPTSDRGPGIGVMFHDVLPEHRAHLDALCPPAKPIVRHGPG